MKGKGFGTSTSQQKTRWTVRVYDDRLVVLGDPIPVRLLLAMAEMGEALGFTHFGDNEQTGARVVMVRKGAWSPAPSPSVEEGEQ